MLNLQCYLPFQGKSHQFKAKMKEREESSLLIAFFSTGFFCQKEKFKSKIEK
jgi:hypothetical protein